MTPEKKAIWGKHHLFFNRRWGACMLFCGDHSTTVDVVKEHTWICQYCKEELPTALRTMAHLNFLYKKLGK